MGKTVFGIPGVNEKSGTGSAIAPRGTTGGTSAGSTSQAGQQGLSGGQEKAPMAKPAMARPAPAPAKSMATPAPAKSAANRTMFGMPAMNLPAQGSAGGMASQPAAASPAPAPAAKPAAEVSATSQPAKVDKSDAAYGATMLGVPAMTDEMARASLAQKPLMADSPVPSQSEPEVSTAVAQPEEVAELPVSVEPEAPVPSTSIPVASNSAPAPVSSSTQLRPPVSRAGEPSKGLVAGLIVGFFMMLVAIGFVAWKFILS